MENIPYLAKLAHKYGKYLVVDNAHGSYLKFLNGKNIFANHDYLREKLHPVDLGADLVCDSAHKTLPVLTGGAYLHICNPKFTENYKDIMKIFSSTSPSYLTLQSLDYANLVLTNKDYLRQLEANASRVKDMKLKYGINTIEPFKIAVKTSKNSSKICEKYDVEPEYVSKNVVLFMFSGSNATEDFEAVDKVLNEIDIKTDIGKNDESNMLDYFGYLGN
jgi:arginine/lysine/ornithine decarboxylase